MNKPKVMTVYGTRPEAIKVAPLISALQEDDRFTSIAVSTGQHREMLEQVNKMFRIEPAYDLRLMKPGQPLNEIVSRAVSGLDGIILAEKPDVIVVQGDTSTAMAAALAGFQRGITVVHLEAGLRTGDIQSPFPEEANRRIIGQVTSLHLTPTSASRDNLLRENFKADDVIVTGNTVIDALLQAVNWDTEFTSPLLAEASASNKRMVLITTHRRENLEVMTEIGLAINKLAQDYSEINFVLPLHLNPKVRQAVTPYIEANKNVIVTDPLPYNEFTKLMARAEVILTDSGGVQEEAPSLGKPVLVMRENTERPEAVRAGTALLIGTDRQRIVEETKKLLDDAAAYEAMANAVNPYGDGRAAQRAVAALAELTGIGKRIAPFSPQL